MSYEAIAVLMFSTFMLLLLTGQRVFGAIGFVASAFALALWGEGAVEMPFASTITLLNWYPMLTLPMFVFMGYMLSESGIASDLYRMFHVWTGPMRGGLSSSMYSLKYNQTNYSAWAPPMAPIKIIMTVGIALMLLQAISIFFKDLAKLTGREIA